MTIRLPFDVKGSVSVENIDFVYSHESIKGGIILNGGIVGFEIALNGEALLNNIQFNSYDNFVDSELELDVDNFVIDYNNITDIIRKQREKILNQT